MPLSGIGCSKRNIQYQKKDSAIMSFRCRILCTFIAGFSVFSLPFILYFIMLQRNETKQKRTEYNGDRKSEKNTYKVVFQMFNRLFIPYRVCGTPVHSITCNRYPVLGGAIHQLLASFAIYRFSVRMDPSDSSETPRTATGSL